MAKEQGEKINGSLYRRVVVKISMVLDLSPFQEVKVSDQVVTHETSVA